MFSSNFIPVSFSIENKFFKSLGYNEFNNVKLIANVELLKKTSFLELSFFISGKVNIFCDVSIEPFDLEINSESNFIVKFSNFNENFSDQEIHTNLNKIYEDMIKNEKN